MCLSFKKSCWDNCRMFLLSLIIANWCNFICVAQSQSISGNNKENIPTDVVVNVILDEGKSDKVWKPPVARVRTPDRSSFWNRWQCKWMARNMPGCRGQVATLRVQMGMITSPAFSPSCQYPEGTVCEWLIVAPEDSVIRIQVLEFNIKANRPDCSDDGLTLYDGENARAPRLATFCGDQRPQGLASSGNYLFLRFQSDRFGQDRGFRLVFWREEKPTPAGALLSAC